MRSANSEDSPEIYFKQVGSHALLTREDEIRLADDLKRVECEAWQLVLKSLDPALIRSTIDDAPSFTEDEHKQRSEAIAGKLSAQILRAADLERHGITAVIAKLAAADHPATNDLTRLCKEAERLRETFARANLRLVISLARKHQLRGLPLADVIQEGNLGLMRAVPRFDPQKGCRFSTFAIWQIRHAIGRAVLNTARAVRIPVGTLERLAKIKEHTQRLLAKFERDPTIEELSEATGLSGKQIQRLGVGRHLVGGAVSLDAPLSDDSDGTLMDMIAGEAVDPVEDLSLREKSARLRRVLDEFPERDRDVIRRRFGIGCDEQTLQEVADVLGLSKERIRQIEVNVLRAMRGSLVDLSPDQ